MCLQLLGILFLLIASLSGILQRWSTRLGKECATLRRRVRRWRQRLRRPVAALALAERNRDVNEKALAEARSYFHRLSRRHFARFLLGPRSVQGNARGLRR